MRIILWQITGGDWKVLVASLINPPGIGEILGGVLSGAMWPMIPPIVVIGAVFCICVLVWRCKPHNNVRLLALFLMSRLPSHDVT